jgi:hypothetical protein
MSYPYPDALWVLAIPEATPSLNAFAYKRSPYVYPRLRGHWLRQIRDAWLVARSQSLALAGFVPPARAHLAVFRDGPQVLDPDNLVGGCKPILDALRRLTLIADDKPAALQLDVHQARAPTGATLLVLSAWRLETAVTPWTDVPEEGEAD